MSFEAVVRELLYLSSAGKHSSSAQATAKLSRPHSASAAVQDREEGGVGRGQEAVNQLLN